MIIIGSLVVGFVLSVIIPRILRGAVEPNSEITTQVDSWTDLVIQDLKESKATPKTASTDVISFSSARDNCQFGYEFEDVMKSYMNDTRITCSCTVPLGDYDWRICVTDSCTESPRTIDIINKDPDSPRGTLAEKGYTIAASAGSEFTWACIRITPGGTR